MVLKNKTIIITGGSLGIGFEVARKCVEEGATVIIAAREQNNLEKAIKKLRSISNENHISYSLDVCQNENVLQFAKWCINNNLIINGLVNCAGIYGPIGRFESISIEEFIETMQINFFGTVLLCHAFLPLLKSDHKKKIINFSGGGAASPFPNYSAYATSKIAIVRFTENIAVEFYEKDFDINCIAPGFVITRLHQKTLDAGPDLATPLFYENTKKKIASGGISIKKAADLTAFLLSSESDGITGKFLSAPYDPWYESNFQNRLRQDKDLATLRRIDEKTFFKKS